MFQAAGHSKSMGKKSTQPMAAPPEVTPPLLRRVCVVRAAFAPEAGRVRCTSFAISQLGDGDAGKDNRHICQTRQTRNPAFAHWVGRSRLGVPSFLVWRSAKQTLCDFSARGQREPLPVTSSVLSSPRSAFCRLQEWVGWSVA